MEVKPGCGGVGRCCAASRLGRQQRRLGRGAHTPRREGGGDRGGSPGSGAVRRTPLSGRQEGKTPFFEAADLGGRESFRGLTTRRFTGDAAVYGNVEVRLPLAGSWGVVGLADIGRVYLEGEESNRWHLGVGGGIWLSSSGHLVTATLASGGEPIRFYVHTGFHFRARSRADQAAFTHLTISRKVAFLP